MDTNALVDRIVEEVLKKLNSVNKKRILALFSGGTIGSKEAFKELKSLSEAGYECQAVLSPAAEMVLGVERLQTELGQMPIFTEKNGLKPGELLKNTDTLLVPVLTLNSAAKVATGIADNLITTIIMQALLMGKPVIAAQNACDPDNPVRMKLGMNQGNQKYIRLFSQNLQTLRDYGINLVDAGSLAAAVRGKSKEDGGLIFNKRVLSAADMALCQGPTFIVGKNTLITPAARDMAEKRGINIIVG